jgi:hypothetical protein
MVNPQKPTVKPAKTGRFVIGRDSFGKISAVEGIEMTAAMKERAGDACAEGLTTEEYRRAIIRSYR